MVDGRRNIRVAILKTEIMTIWLLGTTNTRDTAGSFAKETNADCR